MEGLDSILNRYKANQELKKPPSHEKAASVNAILELLGDNKIYNYSYWLRKVGSASYSNVLEIVKKASDLEGKYNRGGFITNQLKPYANSKAKPAGTRANRRGDKLSAGSKQTRKEVSEQTRVREVDDNERRVES